MDRRSMPSSTGSRPIRTLACRARLWPPISSARAGTDSHSDTATSVLELLALETLRAGRPLRPGSEVDAACRSSRRRTSVLVEQPRRALQESLVRIVQSERPDWGLPLLLGMARLIALDETRRSGRWIVLDAAPAAATVITRERLRAEPACGARSTRARHRRLRQGARLAPRPRARPAGFPEMEFAELEAAGVRLAEVETGLRESRDLRLAWGCSVPARGAPHGSHVPARARGRTIWTRSSEPCGNARRSMPPTSSSCTATTS